ncbi:MAG: hypothetical protein AB8G05_00450 [Oligoflexales bacterium]
MKYLAITCLVIHFLAIEAWASPMSIADEDSFSKICGFLKPKEAGRLGFLSKDMNLLSMYEGLASESPYGVKLVNGKWKFINQITEGDKVVSFHNWEFATGKLLHVYLRTNDSMNLSPENNAESLRSFVNTFRVNHHKQSEQADTIAMIWLELQLWKLSKGMMDQVLTPFFSDKYSFDRDKVNRGTREFSGLADLRQNIEFEIQNILGSQTNEFHLQLSSIFFEITEEIREELLLSLEKERNWSNIEEKMRAELKLIFGIAQFATNLLKYSQDFENLREQLAAQISEEYTSLQVSELYQKLYINFNASRSELVYYQLRPIKNLLAR